MSAQPLMSKKDKRKEKLNPKLRSAFTQKLQSQLFDTVIGQDTAINSVLDSMSRVITGIRNKEKPILTMLFLGPTGVGKTESVKALSHSLFGSRSAFTRINCQELAEPHTVSKLLGSPPGYVGNEIEPLLSEENIITPCEEAWIQSRGIYSDENPVHKKYNPEEGNFLSIILFDEIEKAHPKIWTTLLGIMDDGHLILSNNEIVDFTNSIIIMTTNVGSGDLDTHLKRQSIGFDVGGDVLDFDQLERQAKETVSKHFPPEFINRFNHIVGFRPLQRDSVRKILNLQLECFYETLIEAEMPIKVHFTSAIKTRLIDEGTSPQYGARHLNRVLDEKIFTPISRLVASEQIIMGDVVNVSINNGEISFEREPRTEEQIKNWNKFKLSKIKKPRRRATKAKPKTQAKATTKSTPKTKPKTPKTPRSPSKK